MTDVQRTYDEQLHGQAAGTGRMRAVVHDRYGSPDVLEVRSIERPQPGSGEVLIGVAAASLNPLDWHFLTGTPYLLRLMAGLRRPRRPVRGADVAGIVAELGPDVTELTVGQRVFGTARGSFAEFAVARVGHVAPTPDGLDDGEAAALPIAAITALQALRDHARVQPGHRVLVNGAAGGVGTFAVQLAVAMGAEVTAVCSARNVEMVASLGAHRVVDYTSDDWVDGTQYDAIIDNVGNRSLRDCRRSLTSHGVLVMVSGPKDNRWLDPFRRLVAGTVGFLFASQRFAQFTASEEGSELRALLEYVERGELRSVVERRVGLDEVADALRYLGTGHARAKIVVDVAGP
jgi:NADPH:quinone reductase-like Zn-dependent oxidoreductase